MIGNLQEYEIDETDEIAYVALSLPQVALSCINMHMFPSFYVSVSLFAIEQQYDIYKQEWLAHSNSHLM